MNRLNSPWKKPAGMLACLLILSMAVPDADATYLVRSYNYLYDYSAVDSKCGAQDPATQCYPLDVTSYATSVSTTASYNGYTGSSSADLATGELRTQTSGPTYFAQAGAELADDLTFINIAPGSTQTIGIIINVDGTYQDGSSVSVEAYFSTSSLMSAADTLSMELIYNGNFVATDLLAPVSSTTLSLADPCPGCSSSLEGDWSVMGPTQYVGEINVFGDNPEMLLHMFIGGTGYFDLSNTASISLVLPEGIDFTSSSGVFLSAVPVPGAIWLFGSGLFGLIAITRRKNSS